MDSQLETAETMVRVKKSPDEVLRFRAIAEVSGSARLQSLDYIPRG